MLKFSMALITVRNFLYGIAPWLPSSYTYFADCMWDTGMLFAEARGWSAIPMPRSSFDAKFQHKDTVCLGLIPNRSLW